MGLIPLLLEKYIHVNTEESSLLKNRNTFALRFRFYGKLG